MGRGSVACCLSRSRLVCSSRGRSGLRAPVRETTWVPEPAFRERRQAAEWAPVTDAVAAPPSPRGLCGKGHLRHGNAANRPRCPPRSRQPPTRLPGQFLFSTADPNNLVREDGPKLRRCGNQGRLESDVQHAVVQVVSPARPGSQPTKTKASALSRDLFSGQYWDRSGGRLHGRLRMTRLSVAHRRAEVKFAVRRLLTLCLV